MLWSAYTLHDVKALQYNPPFFAINDAIARRMVGELATDLNTSVGRHPSDFKLYKLGSYDDAKAEFHLLPIMEHVVDIVALIPPPPSFGLPFDVRTSDPKEFKANGEVR